MGRANNQEADALASECLKEFTVGAIKLQEPRLQGREFLHDVLCFLETGEPPPHLTKGERRWLARKSVRYKLINEDLFSPRGRTKCLGRSLPKRTYIASSIHVTMMYVAGILPMRLPCRKVLH